MFKIGDWVKNKDDEIFQLKDLHMWHKDLDSLVKLWKPKEGEWCWFYNHNVNLPNFMMFVAMTKDNLYLATTCKDGCEIEFDYCEPFIGKLPICL